MPRIVVTGADGFIGRPLTELLTRTGNQVIPVTRKDFVLGGQQSSGAKLEVAIQGARAVIHLAGRAHVLREINRDPLAEFRRTNVDGTLAVAEAAARAGVERFVFMSSIGVLGNTSGTARFSESNQPSPQGPYAISKLEAERALQSLAQRTGLQVVLVRPPLVYGANVKGNFLRLLRLVQSGSPLPFGSIDNLRSYVGVHNLCEFLLLCVMHPSAAGRIFHVADGEDVSTPELLEILATSMGRKPRILRCPPALLRAAATMVGRLGELERLITNLLVDSTLARTDLGWRPSKPMRDEIGEMTRSVVPAQI
jgi:nucleoside-diphosphate-sugar epimerase